jgi:hypothetical protein
MWDLSAFFLLWTCSISSKMPKPLRVFVVEKDLLWLYVFSEMFAKPGIVVKQKFFLVKDKVVWIGLLSNWAIRRFSWALLIMFLLWLFFLQVKNLYIS